MNKCVLITGGSRGIGKALVEQFSENGYSVAFTYNSSVEAAMDIAKATGAFPIKANVCSEKEIIDAVKIAHERLGNIDCLINNAGISRFSLFTDIKLSEWNEIMSVNLTAPFIFSREVSRIMISNKSGRIINISSMWGLVGASCEVHYSASKAGLIGMTKALAKELAPSGITVNAIAPGVISTEMNSALGEEVLCDLANETPVGRLGKSEEIAAAALYLAGDGAAFITGEVLNVSGGFVI